MLLGDGVVKIRYFDELFVMPGRVVLLVMMSLVMIGGVVIGWVMFAVMVLLNE